MDINLAIVFVIFINFASCRDFYVGMFKKNDLLVAQDRLYKERVPYRHTYVKYGRIFKCKISYFRVSDRLGYGPGPKVQIIRGGFSNYLVLKLTSPYNMPISVNIYVGCPNTFTTAKPETRESGVNQTVTGIGTGGTQTAEGATIAGSNNSTDVTQATNAQGTNTGASDAATTAAAPAAE